MYCYEKFRSMDSAASRISALLGLGACGVAAWFLWKKTSHDTPGSSGSCGTGCGCAPVVKEEGHADMEDTTQGEDEGEVWKGDANDGRVGNLVQPLPGKQKVFFKTFGCSHNTSDGEYMMGQLQQYGYSFVESLEECDLLVVNSCTVKGPSQDAVTTLSAKAKALTKPMIVTGCVPQADRSVKGLEHASLLGVAQIDRIVEVAQETLGGNRVMLLGGRSGSKVRADQLPEIDMPKIRRNKLIEIIPVNTGCLGSCSYCKTKHARGTLGSYPVEKILGRIESVCTKEGIKQIWLTSEDLGAYGLDIGTNIAELLKAVVSLLETKFPSVMLRLGMTNPPYFLEHVKAVGRILGHPQVFSFVHIPVQSGSNDTLRHMVREYSVEDFDLVVEGLKEEVPSITIATDIICGFPTESERDHEDTLSLIKKHQFPVLNISQFYPRPNTAAAKMQKIPSKTVKARSTEVTQLFESYTTHDHLRGKTVQVWWDDLDKRRGQTVGHTKSYVKVILKAERPDLMGEKSWVKVVDTSKWHAEGELVE